MSSDKLEALEKAHEKIRTVISGQAPMDDIEALVVPEFMGYGTTADEIIHGIEGFKGQTKGLKEQAKAAGIDFKFDMEIIHQRISPEKDAAIFVEHVKTTLSKNGNVFQEFLMRTSTLLECIDQDWKLVHYHCSIPSDTENDTWHLNEWKAEKEKLEKLVAEQTADLRRKNLDLEIEAASERVRTHAMGMQEPNDIMNVLNVMKEEVDKFDLGNIATWIWTKDKDGLITQWDISEVIEEGNLVNFNLKFDINKWPEVNRHSKEWEKGKKYYTLNWRGENSRM
jgi:hypothetical protein